MQDQTPRRRPRDGPRDARFGNNPQGLEMGPWGQMELYIALTVANEIDQQLCLLHPQFASMAEQHLPNTPSN